MKIKQHGNIPTPEPWELDVTCKKCGAIITLEGPNDMFKRRSFIGFDSFFNLYGNDTFHYICSDCGSVNKIESTKISIDILSEIKYKEFLR